MNNLQELLDEYRLLYKELPKEDQVEIVTLANMIPKCRVCEKQAAVFNEWYCGEECQDKLYPPHLIKGVRKRTIEEMQAELRKMAKEAHVKR